MFVVLNEIGVHEDRETWSDVVRAGHLCAYLEAKRRNPPRRTNEQQRRLFIVANFGSYTRQAATPVRTEVESLFATPGESVQIAVLRYPDDRDPDSLRMTISRISDDAFEKAVNEARTKLGKSGWCSLELQVERAA